MQLNHAAKAFSDGRQGARQITPNCLIQSVTVARLSKIKRCQTPLETELEGKVAAQKNPLRRTAKSSNRSNKNAV
jgi:hypothetical protein